LAIPAHRCHDGVHHAGYGTQTVRVAGSIQIQCSASRIAAARTFSATFFPEFENLVEMLKRIDVVRRLGIVSFARQNSSQFHTFGAERRRPTACMIERDQDRLVRRTFRTASGRVRFPGETWRESAREQTTGNLSWYSCCRPGGRRRASTRSRALTMRNGRSGSCLQIERRVGRAAFTSAHPGENMPAAVLSCRESTGMPCRCVAVWEGSPESRRTHPELERMVGFQCGAP
jgi:hypothetical protein